MQRGNRLWALLLFTLLIKNTKTMEGLTAWTSSDLTLLKKVITGQVYRINTYITTPTMASELRWMNVRMDFSLTSSVEKTSRTTSQHCIWLLDTVWVLHFSPPPVANMRTSIPLNADDIISLLQTSNSLKRQTIPVMKIV